MKHKVIFSIRHKDKTWRLVNYKKAWIANGVRPQFFIKTNGASKKNGDTCFDLSIAFWWWIFSYTNWNLQGR